MSRSSLWLYLVIFATLIALAFIIPGTGDDGDSVLHYLYARWAFVHPENFFNHWAKPLFVLISSPFAHFGMVGMKVMNAIFLAGSFVLVHRFSLHLNQRHHLIAPFVLLLIPASFVLTFSGLTEPMFAFFLMLGLLLFHQNKFIPALIVVSYLPFVRSEGLIVLSVFALVLFYQKQFRFLPLLLTGHLVYGLVGLLEYDSILWPITEILYQTQEGYGSGGPTDFVYKLLNVLGVPLFVMFWLGLVAEVKSIVAAPKHTSASRGILFVIAAAYIIGHAVFWWQGWFHSMGLSRVLIGIAPLLAILCTEGILLIHKMIKGTTLPQVWLVCILGYVLIFPFTSNPAAPKLDVFELSESQLAIDSSISALEQKFSENAVFFWAPYVSLAADIDYFNKVKHRTAIHRFLEGKGDGAIVVWDWWYAVQEGGIPLELLETNGRLDEIHRAYDDQGNPLIVVFESKY